MAETALRETGRLSASDLISDMLAQAWLAELEGAGRTPDELLNPNSSERIVLTDLASRLVSILFGTPFVPEEAEAVGRALVAADFIGSDVLGRSLWVLMLRLPVLIRALCTRDELCGGDETGPPGALGAGLEHRLAEVTGALANGYVSELQTRTLAEQESIRRAELDAERLVSRRLLHQATHDPLTGLPNRAATFARLSAALTAGPGARIGLCYLDLDGFKAVNDRHGHGSGDQLLAAIAARIGRVARHHRAMAARIGGDEFVVLAEESPGLGGMITLASRVLAEARRPVTLASGPVSVSACAGIVERPASGVTAESVLADADTALYEAKSRGSDRWHVHQAPA